MGVEPGWNPIYQGRNVAQYSQSHETVELETAEQQPAQEEKQESLVGENLPEGPCGTTPQKV